MEPSIKHRPAEQSDMHIIANFPQSEDELFFMFPKANYPLTEGQLAEAASKRFHSTVITHNGEVAAFANFYEVVPGEHCSIGNVVVNPVFRGLGIGHYLINVMEELARINYGAKETHISCFNHNTNGLLLYHKLGYLPYFIEKRLDKENNPLALIMMRKRLAES